MPGRLETGFQGRPEQPAKGRMGDEDHPAGGEHFRGQLPRLPEEVPADQDVVTPVGQMNRQPLHKT